MRMNSDVVPGDCCERSEVSGPLKWCVLILCSISMLGICYAYDAVAPVADLLQKLRGLSSSQIGLLNAIYSVPGIFVAVVGGVIVDRVGPRRATLYFAVICLGGALLTASTGRFPLMAAGRLVFGLGAESITVAITTALGQWFAGRELGFALGVNLSIARLGSYAADLSPIWAESLYRRGWQPPLYLAAGIAGAALLAAVGYFIVEGVSQRPMVTAKIGGDVFRLRDIFKGVDASYWYVTGLCVTFYSVIFPFRSTFGIEYFQHVHGRSLQEAGAINSYVFLAAIISTPAFGFLADRSRHKAVWMLFGAASLFTAFVLLIVNVHQSVALSTLLMGVSFALVPAVLWPAVAYLVSAARLGTAYGLMIMMQNAGLFVANLVAGFLNDRYGASATNPSGYDPMISMFTTLSLLGVVFGVALLRRERRPAGHGLEQR